MKSFFHLQPASIYFHFFPETATEMFIVNVNDADDVEELFHNDNAVALFGLTMES